MGTLWSVLMGITLLSALGIIGLILMQQGKGADLGAAMGGGGASGSVFGASGGGNFLSRATGVLAAVFFVSTLALTYLGQSKNRVANVATQEQQQTQEDQNVSVLERLQASSAAGSGAAATGSVAGDADASNGDSNANADIGGVDANNADANTAGDGEQSDASATGANSTGADASKKNAESPADGTTSQDTNVDENTTGKAGTQSNADQRVAVEPGALTVFFASGQSAVAQSDLPKDMLDTTGFAKAVADGKKLFISGYVDSTGNADQNKELAKKRAQAVQAVLVESGIAADAIELQKPDAIELGEGAAARRVEVRVQ